MTPAGGKIISDNNIRSLIYHVGIIFDRKLAALAGNTPYQKVRDSDSRVFMAATRARKTISEIARNLHISRQSAQSSVSRLVKFGIVKLENHPSSKREKIVAITDAGWRASKFASDQLMKIEKELERTIGIEAYSALRGGLEKLVQRDSQGSTSPPLHRN